MVIAPEQHDPPLHQCDARWLGQLASGMRWILIGIVLSFVFTAVTCVLTTRLMIDAFNQAETGEIDYTSLTPAWMTVTVALSIALLSVIFFVGCWRVTATEPGRQSIAPSFAMTKWTCVPAFAMNIPASLALLGGDIALLAIASLGVKLIALSLLSLGFPASLIYLRFLARRIPAPGLARQTTIVFWGQFIAGIVLIAGLVLAVFIVIAEYQRNAGTDLGLWIMWVFAPGLISILVFLIWWVVLMVRYSAQFNRTAVQAANT